MITLRAALRRETIGFCSPATEIGRQPSAVLEKLWMNVPLKKLILARGTTPGERMRFEMGTLFCFSAGQND
jgi:hypothetical protein